jgi:hypothetical protein
MTYSILGIDYSNGDVKTTTLHECDSSIEANSWVVGYVRHDRHYGRMGLNQCSWTKWIY